MAVVSWRYLFDRLGRPMIVMLIDFHTGQLIVPDPETIPAIDG